MYWLKSRKVKFKITRIIKNKHEVFEKIVVLIAMCERRHVACFLAVYSVLIAVVPAWTYSRLQVHSWQFLHLLLPLETVFVGDFLLSSHDASYGIGFDIFLL